MKDRINGKVSVEKKRRTVRLWIFPGFVCGRLINYVEKFEKFYSTVLLLLTVVIEG